MKNESARELVKRLLREGIDEDRIRREIFFDFKGTDLNILAERSDKITRENPNESGH